MVFITKRLDHRLYNGLKNSQLSEQDALKVYAASEIGRKKGIKNVIISGIPFLISLSFYIAKSEYGYFASLDYNWQFFSLAVFMVSFFIVAYAVSCVFVYGDYIKAFKIGYSELLKQKVVNALNEQLLNRRDEEI